MPLFICAEDQSGSSGGDIRRRSSANYGRTLKRLKKARVGSISEDPNSPPGSPGLAFDAVDRSDQDLQEKELSDFEKTHLFAIRGTFKSKDISYLFSCPSQMELQKWKRKLGNRRGGELINVTPLMLAILSGRNLVANFLIKLSDSQVQDSKVPTSPRRTVCYAACTNSTQIPWRYWRLVGSCSVVARALRRLGDTVSTPAHITFAEKKRYHLGR